MIDLEGRIVGVNTAKEMADTGNQGLGFAIPAYMVREVVDEILANGRVERGWFGFQVRDLTPGRVSALGLEGEPVSVTRVISDSPAERAGLRESDVLVSIDGAPVAGSRGVLDSIARLAPGSRVPVDVLRDGDEELLYVEVGRRGDQ